MTKSIERFLIESQDNRHGDVLSIQIALGLAKAWCDNETQNGGTKDAVLLIPTRGNADGSTLETALGAGTIKALLSKKRVPLGKNGLLRLDTTKTFEPFRKCDILIVVYAMPKTLDLADSSNAQNVIAVPWLPNEIERWRQTWNPKRVQSQINVNGQIDINIVAAPETSSVPVNPVVEEALKMLAGMINVSTGLSHPLDKPKAIALFRLLHKHGEKFEAPEVRAWALRNGWSPHHATQLEEVAQAILDRKRIQGARETIYNVNTLRTLRALAGQERHRKSPDP